MGVSLSTVLTASKGNENVLLTRVSARDKIRGKGGLSEKDAFEVCDGCVRRRGTYYGIKWRIINSLVTQ